MSMAIQNDSIATPALDRLATEINQRFFAPDTNYDGDRLNLLEQVLDFAAKAEQQLVIQNMRIVELEAMTRTDELTGLLNRRGLEADLARLLADAARNGGNGVICYIDIDDFKSINDRFGHAVGDEALRLVSSNIADNTRLNDLAARVGGDEFVVVLTATSVRNGLAKARTLQNNLDRIHLRDGGRKVPITVSLGIQSYDGTTDLDDILQRADTAMYVEKRARKTALVPIAT